MQVALLCGGKGTRLQERTASLPKPLIEVGGRPILWHVMKLYSHFGHRDFVLCLGYMAGTVKEFFARHDQWRHHDFRLHVATAGDDRIELLGNREDWTITFIDTGLETNTGGRLHRIADYITEERFCANYSDGLGDIDMEDLLRFHRAHGKLATLTAVRPRSQFGVLTLGGDGLIESFAEKPVLDNWINAGFFVFEKGIFDYIGPNDALEADVFPRLIAAGELMAYKHQGFWACMDTYKDTMLLNQAWSMEQAPWKIWDS